MQEYTGKGDIEKERKEIRDVRKLSPLSRQPAHFRTVSCSPDHLEQSTPKCIAGFLLQHVCVVMGMPLQMGRQAQRLTLCVHSA